MLCTRLDSETKRDTKCRDPGSSVPTPAASPVPPALPKTSAGRRRRFCTSAAPLAANNSLGEPALQAWMGDCKRRCSFLLPPQALDAGSAMKQQLAVLARDGIRASEGRETDFLPFLPPPVALSLYCSSEQCPRSLI